MRKVHRTRADIERERKALLDKSEHEIDAIVAEYHAQLPRERATSVGSIYARYSSQFQDSVHDQVRTIFEEAYKLGIFIPREHVYYDLAVRGYKDRRPGLTALREAIKEKAFEVFLVFTTSRLFRRTYKALQFVEEELVERGIRAIFVRSQLDTANGDNWRTMFQLFATMDEAAVRMYPEHVRAAHEGLFLRRMVCGSLPLGYTGEVVPGEFTKRNRPRRRIIIDPQTRAWIERIFEWYVQDGVSLNEIVRRLNDDPNAPAPAKSMTGWWRHELVRSHLTKPCYRVYWTYGATETKWSSDKDYAQQVPRSEPLKSGQFEDLRIVSDGVWFKAQELLSREKSRSGRKSKDGDRKSRPRLLRGLFVCPEHKRRLIVGGAKGGILFCPTCQETKADKRPLFSCLNRALALRLTCKQLAELVCPDEQLVCNIIAECQREAKAIQEPDPAELDHLRSRAEKLSRTIDFNRRNPGDTEEELRDTEQLLKKLRSERATILADIGAYEAAQSCEVVVPSEAEVRAMLDGLADILTSAAEAETDEEMRTARGIIDELTGGRIELFQMGERRRRRGWLQGRFRVDVATTVAGKLTSVRPALTGAGGLDVVIDYRRILLIDDQMEEAKGLWDQGLLNKRIAEEMGVQPCYITKLLNRWFDSRGLPRPDNRRRRAQLEQKQTSTPTYKRIADEVVRLADAGMSNLAIGRQLGVSSMVVRQALAWWHSSRGLPVPTDADRRRKVLRRADQMYEAGTLVKDIASELGYSRRGMKLALRRYRRERGKTMTDGRARRGNVKSGQRAAGHAANRNDPSKGTT